MKSISKLEMPTEDWLALRKHSVGASDVATLLHLNPYKTIYQLWEEKIAEAPLAQIDNDATHFGNKLEETVAQEYAERSGRKILRDNKIRVHPDCEFLTCNLDRVILPMNGEGRGVLECKTSLSQVVRNWDAEIPPMYYTQVQTQLAITGWKWGVLALLVDGRTFSTFDIERDDKFITSVLAIVNSFWFDYVIPKLPPPAVVADYTRMSSNEGMIVEANEAAVAAHQQLVRVKSDIKLLEENQEQLENTIKMALGTAEAIVIGNTTLATWKTAKASVAFDAKKFKADHPDMAAQYEITKPGSRRFLLKEGK